MTTCGCGSGAQRCRQCNVWCCEEHFSVRAEIAAGQVHAGVGVRTSGRHTYVEIPGEPEFVVTLASGATRRYTPPSSLGGVALTGGARDAYLAGSVTGDELCISCRSRNGATATLEWRARLEAELAVRRAEEATAAQVALAAAAEADAHRAAVRAHHQQVHDAHVDSVGGLDEIRRLTADRARWIRVRHDALASEHQAASQRLLLGRSGNRSLTAELAWVVAVALGGVTVASLVLGADDAVAALLVGAGIILLAGLIALAWARTRIAALLLPEGRRTFVLSATIDDPRRPAIAAAAIAAAAAAMALGMHRPPWAAVAFVVASVALVAATGAFPWAKALRTVELRHSLERGQARTAGARIDELNTGLRAYRCGQAICPFCASLEL